MRTSNLTEREISGIEIITQGRTQLLQVNRAITQTIVAKKNGKKSGMISVKQETERETALVDTLRSRISTLMETGMMIKLTRFQNQSQIVQSCGTSGWSRTRSSDQSERCTKETSTCDKIEKILPKTWRPCKEKRKIHRRVEESDVV